MRVVQPGAGLDADLDRGLRIQLALGLQELRARAAAHVLHDDVVTPGVDAGVVDLDDVGVDELRDGERLAPEARDEALVVREVLGEDLHRDGPLKDRVRRPEDGRHPTRAEAVLDPVAIGDQLSLGAARAHSPPGPIPPEPPVVGGGGVWVCVGVVVWVVVGGWVRVVVVGSVVEGVFVLVWGVVVRPWHWLGSASSSLSWLAPSWSAVFTSPFTPEGSWSTSAISSSVLSEA